MIWVFAIGLFLLALALPVPGDWVFLNRPGLRLRFSQLGLVCLSVALIFGDFNAQAAAFIVVFALLAIVVGELLFWLEGGRFTPNRIRAGFRWFFLVSGPGSPPIRGGFLGLGVVTLVLLAMLLVVRPVVRTAVGLEESAEAEPFAQRELIWGELSA